MYRMIRYIITEHSLRRLQDLRRILREINLKIEHRSNQLEENEYKYITDLNVRPFTMFVLTMIKNTNVH